MAPDHFHEHPFDEGTITKLQILELYTREWLPVFLAQDVSRWTEIHLFDFFAGPGTDSEGILGSPLRLVDQLSRVRGLRGWPHTRAFCHFSDSDAAKVERLRSRIAAREVPSDIVVEIQRLDFVEALNQCAPILSNRQAAKLLFIDQYGVDSVTPPIFRKLVDAPTCDFLFFISSSTLNRFRDHPAIKQKISIPGDHYHVHRATLEYYRSLLPQGTQYHLAPFSIKKGSNIYGLIFGSAHPLGMDKFLHVAWKADEINGEADFDIHRDNFQPDQLRFDLADFRPTKLTAFERELALAIRTGEIQSEAHVVRFCFRHGVKREHAKTVLSELKSQKVIEAGFRVPQIEAFKNPRPIRLLKTPQRLF
jgi:three-Cys-motif partner protein